MGSGWGSRSPTSTSYSANDQNSKQPMKTASSMEQSFDKRVKKIFQRNSSQSEKRTVEIRGSADKFPYWTNVACSNGQVVGDNSTNMEYLRMGNDGEVVGVTPTMVDLPYYLHHQLNRTMRLALRYCGSSLTSTKQAHYQEYRVLKKSVRRVLVRFTLDKRRQLTKPEPDIRVYEQHFSGRRRQPFIRPMRVKKVIADSYGNMTLMGDNFFLILHNRMSEDGAKVQGIYTRVLDTHPQQYMIFRHTQHGHVDTNESDVMERRSNEYSEMLLNERLKPTTFHFRLV